jgi:hypothetical protein
MTYPTIIWHAMLSTTECQTDLTALLGIEAAFPRAVLVLKGKVSAAVLISLLRVPIICGRSRQTYSRYLHLEFCMLYLEICRAVDITSVNMFVQCRLCDCVTVSHIWTVTVHHLRINAYAVFVIPPFLLTILKICAQCFVDEGSSTLSI